jgi:hypothetical protein
LARKKISQREMSLGEWRGVRGNFLSEPLGTHKFRLGHGVYEAVFHRGFNGVCKLYFIGVKGVVAQFHGGFKACISWDFQGGRGLISWGIKGGFEGYEVTGPMEVTGAMEPRG